MRDVLIDVAVLLLMFAIYVMALNYHEAAVEWARDLVEAREAVNGIYASRQVTWA